MTQRHAEDRLLRGLQVTSLDKEPLVTESGPDPVCRVNLLGQNPFPLFPSPLSLPQQILLSVLCVPGIVRNKVRQGPGLHEPASS